MKSNRYHFIGIGGIGMSGLARILLDKKCFISGSDPTYTDNIQDLIKKGAYIEKGHSAKHIHPHATVIYSSDIPQSNPEYQAALAFKCPLIHRSDLLAELMEEQRSFLVAGTHGKTTTTSLLAHIFMIAGCDPSFAIGGMIGGLNGRWGKGDFFIAETDESDGSFLNSTPYGAIVTNIDREHLNFYKTQDALDQAFSDFISKVRNPNFLFYCGDDKRLKALSMEKGFSYGFGEGNQISLSNFRQDGWRLFFDLFFEGRLYSDIEVALIGQHNALNASAVFALCIALKLPENLIRKALREFPGVTRRCQKRGEIQNVLFLDDYAHHPTEIRETLKGIKQSIKERRLIVIFQPHRYTRVHDLVNEFGRAFDWADLVFVTELYSARETPIEGISEKVIIDQIKKESTVPVSFLSKKDLLNIELYPFDVVVTMGAGDITNWIPELLENLPIKKYRMGLIFGGMSCEHEISLRSSKNVAKSLSTSLYDISFFGINKKGEWLTPERSRNALEGDVEALQEEGHHFFDSEISSKLKECDLFLPILHGTYGEDGTIQGLFEMLGKPYVGPDQRSCAVSMDKVMTKRLAQEGGVPTPKYHTFSYIEWIRTSQFLLQKIERELHFPLFIKPTHLGSSIGITKVEKIEYLESAINNAFRFDFEVMIEEGKENCRELEFAVIGNPEGFGIQTAAPGEKLAQGMFVNYDLKYSTRPVQTTVYPELSLETLEKGKELAQKAYLAVKGSGMMRVDFLLDRDENYWFFELNPIPGMTALSLFPKIWKREGVETEQLLNQLIIYALQRRRQQDRHFTSLTVR